MNKVLCKVLVKTQCPLIFPRKAFCKIKKKIKVSFLSTCKMKTIPVVSKDPKKQNLSLLGTKKKYDNLCSFLCHVA